MIIAVLAVLVVASVPLTGGELRRLGSLPLRHLWVPPVAIVAQTVAIDGIPQLVGLASVLHLATYVLLVWWLWRHRDVGGLWLLGAGGIANFLAISTNGGFMPASPDAMATAGLATSEGFSNSAATTDAPLWFLGDVFALPSWFPLANVFSVGDVLLLVGLAWLVHSASRGGAVEPAADQRPAVVPDTVEARPVAVVPLATASAKRRFIGASHRWSLDEVQGRHGSAQAA